MSPAGPVRPLGPWSCLALVVGNLIGSGIYLLPATLAPLGANALIGWGVTIAGALCLATVFARLAAALPVAGGPYAYARAAFGPAVGFAVAWSYWTLIWAGNGAVALAAVSALSLVFPALTATPAASVGAALVIVWALVAVNIRGVSLAARVQLLTVALKLVPLAAVVVLGGLLLLRDGGAAVAPATPVPIAPGAIATAAALTFWGFLGLESATVPADKVSDAARVVPRATLVGTALTGAIYFAVAATIALLLPPAATASSPAPVALFLGRTLGDGAAAIVALFAAISAIGAVNGFILLQGELPWAMARGGVFPAWLGRSGRRGTPARAHLVAGALLSSVLLLNVTGRTAQLFQDIASISLAAGMLAYLACAGAAIRLLPRDRMLRLAALVSAGFVIWMIWGLGWRANLWGLGLLGLGVPVYLSVRRGRVVPPGESGESVA